MNNTNHKTMLSEHFALEEFTYSRIAVENALDNTPPAAAKTALNHLVTYLLEPLRKFYKSPVAILKAVRKEPDAGTCLYDLCYLFVPGLRIKKEHTPIGTVRLQRFRRFHP